MPLFTISPISGKQLADHQMTYAWSSRAYPGLKWLGCEISWFTNTSVLTTRSSGARSKKNSRLLCEFSARGLKAVRKTRTLNLGAELFEVEVSLDSSECIVSNDSVIAQADDRLPL